MAKCKQIAIPENIREQADQLVARFNKRAIKDQKYSYVARYRGVYLYLDRHIDGQVEPICRLKYRGALDKWDFAIYKYSREKYDPDEWFFPGAKHVDGTIEGAMKAGLEAYPLSDYKGTGPLKDVLAFLMGQRH
jgi:hypothetical protein